MRRASAAVLVTALTLSLAPLSGSSSAAAGPRRVKETRRYVGGTGIGVIVAPQAGLVGGVTFTPPAGATMATFQVVDDVGAALGLPTAAAACQDGADGGFCGGVQRDFCTQTRTPVAIDGRKELDVAIFAGTTCGSTPAVGTTGTVVVTFIIPKPPPPLVIVSKTVLTDSYPAAVGTPLASALPVVFTPPKKATHLLLRIEDVGATAFGLATSATACQDNNRNRICGEEGETRLDFCSANRTPLAIKPGLDVSVFVDVVNVCDSGPAIGTSGDVFATFIVVGRRAARR